MVECRKYQHQITLILTLNLKQDEKIILKEQDKEFEFVCVSMGNPHAIIFVDDVDDFDVEKYGKI